MPLRVADFPHFIEYSEASSVPTDVALRSYRYEKLAETKFLHRS
jgi:hypothetical protein